MNKRQSASTLLLAWLLPSTAYADRYGICDPGGCSSDVGNALVVALLVLGLLASRTVRQLFFGYIGVIVAFVGVIILAAYLSVQVSEALGIGKAGVWIGLPLGFVASFKLLTWDRFWTVLGKLTGARPPSDPPT